MATNEQALLESQKQELCDKISEKYVKAANDYNDFSNHLGNGINAASLSFLALVLPFASSIKDVFVSDFFWMLIVAVVLFCVSIIFWCVNYILSLALFNRVMSRSIDIFYEADKCMTLSELNSVKIIEVGGLNSNKYTRSSEVPKFFQVITFVFAVFFCVASIIVFLIA